MCVYLFALCVYTLPVCCVCLLCACASFLLMTPCNFHARVIINVVIVSSTFVACWSGRAYLERWDRLFCMERRISRGLILAAAIGSEGVAMVYFRTLATSPRHGQAVCFSHIYAYVVCSPCVSIKDALFVVFGKDSGTGLLVTTLEIHRREYSRTLTPPRPKVSITVGHSV